MDNYPPDLIVDAWPMMEWIQGREPAASGFESILQAAARGETRLAMSRINRGEVMCLVRKNFRADVVGSFLEKIQSLPIQLLSVSDELIDAAVDLKSVYPISFADAFAAAEARRASAPLITGDHEFMDLQKDGLIQLRWLGA